MEAPVVTPALRTLARPPLIARALCPLCVLVLLPLLTGASGAAGPDQHRLFAEVRAGGRHLRALADAARADLAGRPIHSAFARTQRAGADRFAKLSYPSVTHREAIPAAA